MFIDTDTTTDVRAIVADLLRRRTNSLNADVATHSRPGYTVPKSQIRASFHELRGIIDTYYAVFHQGEAEGFDTALVAAAHAAREAVRNLNSK